MKAFGTLLLTVFQIFIATAIAAGQEKGPAVSLRAGQLTLKPVGRGRPVVSSEAADIKIGKNRSLTLKEAEAADQPISGRHVVLEFERRLSQKDYPALEAKGVKIFSYLEGNSYTASIDQNSTAKLAEATKDIDPCIRYGVIESQHKIAPSLTAPSQPSSDGLKKESREPALVSVELWPDADFGAVKAELAKIGRVESEHEYTKRLDIVLPSEDAVHKLADNKYVKFIAPKKKPVIHNTHIRNNVGANAVQAAQPGLIGTNVKVAVFDEGHVARDHPSFRGRLAFDPQGDQGTAYRPRPHATHVAGTIAASGDYDAPSLVASQGKVVLTEDLLPGYGENLSVTGGPSLKQDRGLMPTALPPAALEKKYPGVAPGAQIVSYDFTNASDKLIGLLIKAPQSIDLVSNSWGEDLSGHCDDFAAYVYFADDYDRIISGRIGETPVRRIPVVFSAGNYRSGNDCGMRGYRTVSPPATAKNVIAVGAIDADDNSMTPFSGFGPTQDGRIKPDLVAPGCRNLGNGVRGIVSTVPQTGIGWVCGTSQAAPAVSGAVAVMMQKLQDSGSNKADIYPSTYKALLIHAADDLGKPGPDYSYGYGRVRLRETLALIDNRAFTQAEVKREGEIVLQTVAVPAGAKEIKVTLVWDDPPRSAISSGGLTNDLDLTLISPTRETILPWVLNPAQGREGDAATRGADHANVVEQVSVSNPAAGNWQISVRAEKLGNARFSQTYSLAVTAE
jgi:hypothetical protein